jgi:hypothetical protein
MKTFFFLSFLIFSKVSFLLSDKSLELSNAFNDIASEIFTKLNLTFDIYFYGKPTHHSTDVINNFLKESNFNVEIFWVENFDFQYALANQQSLFDLLKNSEHHVIHNSAIFVTSTIDDAIILMNSFKFSTFVLPKKFQFLLFVEEIKDEKDLYKIPNRKKIEGSDHISKFCYYVIETKKKVQLYTVDIFREGACGSFDYVEIGSFDKKLKKWKNEKLEIEEKYTNFHNCLMVARTGLEKFTEKIINLIGEKANFTSHVLGDLEGIMLASHTVFLPVPLFALSFDNLWVTSTFAEMSYGFYLTPAEKYSSYEKMVMPFDVETWTYLGITFGVAFFVVFVVGFLPRKVYLMIVGSRVQHPEYNILSIFYGVGQSKIPTENSARILLMFFIFFCLIFRTAYQGVLFELMTSDISKKLPKTIEELYEQNYTIFVHKDDFGVHVQMLEEMLPEYQHSTVIPITSRTNSDKYINFFMDHMYNDSEKFAFFMEDNPIQIFMFENNISVPRLDQTFFRSPAGVGLSKNNFLFFLCDKIVQDLTSTGIMQIIWKDIYVAEKLKVEEKEPQVLSVQDLEFGFVLWLITLSAPTCVFALELLTFYVIRKIKNYLVRETRSFIGKVLFFKLLIDLYFR